ncbi:ATP phosphoribosyltransferase regulatory subunit [Risungbinella massiliensis]|uniref:ATP phosphoribosyltransferase regulatory subunit n=1 Tax=Risungbinella massiliensis TaxID=1329796 RepID=UPI0005CB8E04|nr:ATP phosphoribosyltransferase regulatory subunit [Risungbinella massiliensis]
MKKVNVPLPGLSDRFGPQLIQFEYLQQVLGKIARRFGYQPLEVPILEYQDSFSEDVVGTSPWPEWNEKGCFYLEVPNYHRSYNEKPDLTRALLIPEGTISVTRWLGNWMDQNPGTPFPLKVYYELSCFRNELTSELSAAKHRQFKQLGVEILGSSNLHADTEIIYLIHRMLNELGIASSDITFRFNHVHLFRMMVEDCRIEWKDALIIKESMDALAECRAGKKPERWDHEYMKIQEVLSSYDLSLEQQARWQLILHHKEGTFTELYYKQFPIDYHPYFDQMNQWIQDFKKVGIYLVADLCVIRSHEYYTGLSYEVDVHMNGKSFIEIAGGGRYDKLVEHFVSSSQPASVPCTGFAFGTERLFQMCQELGLFPQETRLTLPYLLGEEEKIPLVYPKDSKVWSYLEMAKMVEDQLETFHIYVGEENAEKQAYLDFHHLEEVLVVHDEDAL